MKVLFLSAMSFPTDGGSYSYLTAVLEGLKKCKPVNHEFEFAHFHTMHSGPRRLPGCDFIWFLEPRYVPVTEPFAVTVWDLGHRVLPFMPEVSVSGWPFDQREAFYANVLPKAAIISVGNDTGAEQIRYTYRIPSERFLWNPLPIPDELPQAEGSFEMAQSWGLQHQRYLLYPAQFWPHKNHITVVDAFVQIQNDNGIRDLVFAGADKGNRKFVMDHVPDHLRPRVHFPGYIPRDELIGLYRAAYCTVFASLLGPDNLPPLESMALGTPVVCANYPGASDQLLNAALRFDPLNAEECAGQILKVSEKRELLVSNGRRLADACTVSRYVERIVNALDSFARYRHLWGHGYSEVTHL